MDLMTSPFALIVESITRISGLSDSATVQAASSVMPGGRVTGHFVGLYVLVQRPDQEAVDAGRPERTIVLRYQEALPRIRQGHLGLEHFVPGHDACIEAGLGVVLVGLELLDFLPGHVQQFVRLQQVDSRQG